MTTKLAEWASELHQITKIRPSDASGGKLFQRRCKLRMAGAELEVIWEMSDKDGQIAGHIATPV